MIKFLMNIFKKKPQWVYGTCNNRPARKHRKNGNVQFVLWKAGEHGHKEDFWHNFGDGHEVNFKPTDPVK